MPAHYQELEDELTFEDIIIFRAMAEREEALRSDRGRKGSENSWGIGGWVSQDDPSLDLLRLVEVRSDFYTRTQWGRGSGGGEEGTALVSCAWSLRRDGVGCFDDRVMSPNILAFSTCSYG